MDSNLEGNLVKKTEDGLSFMGSKRRKRSSSRPFVTTCYRNNVLFLILISVTLFALSSSAPATSSGFKSRREEGCYYLLKHYKNGQVITTNEACLNCTCLDSKLMCYLQVCPYVRPIADRCLIERVPGECCPRITCPDQSELYQNSGSICHADGEKYNEGERIQQLNPCEVCYCIRNASSCIVQEYALNVSGCRPILSPGSCCPSRYDCSEGTTTTLPGDVGQPEPSSGCHMDGKKFLDGQAIPSGNPCQQCYCMRNEVVCAVQECIVPCQGCIPISGEEDQCCPEKYECTPPITTIVNGSNRSSKSQGVFPHHVTSETLYSIMLMETDTEKYQSTTMSTDDVVITGIDEDIMSSVDELNDEVTEALVSNSEFKGKSEILWNSPTNQTVTEMIESVTAGYVSTTESSVILSFSKHLMPLEASKSETIELSERRYISNSTIKPLEMFARRTSGMSHGSNSSYEPSQMSIKNRVVNSSLPLDEEYDSCIFQGRLYQSAEHILHPHPCFFCLCFRGDIICLQQTCAPPIHNCYKSSVDGFCCPRYECPVDSILHLSARLMSSPVEGCMMDGTFYRVGERIKDASSSCLECRCDHAGMVMCDPQVCEPPTPLLLRMYRKHS